MPQLSRPKVVVGIPSGVTEVERRAVWESALTAGARECYLIEEPMAAAVGAGVSVFEPNGVMIVDIGGGTTETAVISLGGIVVNRSIKVAGYDMDQALVNYIRLRHGLLIGDKTAEDLKLNVGSAYETKSKFTRSESLGQNSKDDQGNHNSHERMAVIRGRDIETGLPKSLRITDVEVREALSPVLTQIIDAVAEVLEDAPPELTSDILEHGVLLTGGGSLLRGLDQLIVERTHISVIRSEDPLTSVVRGTGKVLEDENLLQRVKVIGGLK